MNAFLEFALERMTFQLFSSSFCNTEKPLTNTFQQKTIRICFYQFFRTELSEFTDLSVKNSPHLSQENRKEKSK